MAAIVRLLARYRVTLAVIVVPILATLVARAIYGRDPSASELRQIGYGIPSLEEGHWWTLLTGMVLVSGLAIPIPGVMTIPVFLYERVGGSRRALTALVGGQILAVLIVLTAILWLRDSSDRFAREVTTAIDFGLSNGAFACLGAWTAYLTVRWRRPVRWAVTCYHIGPLLFSGLIYDLTHPVGWLLGLAAGPWLMRPRVPARAPLRRRDERATALGIVIGLAIGAYNGWNAGGIGGVFGWGPGG